jgi:small ligand-binding sensory domain FIST
MVEAPAAVKGPPLEGAAPARGLARRCEGSAYLLRSLHMLLAGSGLATGKRADEAALDAALQAMAASGLAHADVALVFTSGEAHPAAHHVLHGVRRVTGARVVVGASGAGVLTERAEVEQVPAVAVLVAGGGMLARAVLVPERERIDAGAAVHLAAETGATLAEGGSLLILSDVNLDPRGLLRGLADELGPVTVAGVVAAGAPPFELCNTEVAQGGLAALAVAGPLPVIGVGQGCQPIGEPYVVTRGEGAVVRAIAGRPALDVLKDAIRSLPDFEQRAPRAGIFAGLAMDPAKSPLGRGDFLVRNLAGVDKDSGAVAVSGEVRVGQTIQFQIRDAEAARRDLEAMLTRVEKRLSGHRAAFGVYFNCAGRGRALYGVPDHDVGLIRARLAGCPLIGVFGNGEFAPVGGANFFHTYTGVLVVFAQS